MNIIWAVTNSRELYRLGYLALAVAAIGSASIATATAQQSFKTPEAAADALVAAARSGDRQSVKAVLGPGGMGVVSSGDAVEDNEMRKAFVAAYDAKHAITLDGDKSATLVVGQNDYPLPIPLVQNAGTWKFDTVAGREEILARRIGRDELAAIQVCLAYYDAQNEYADMTAKADGLATYAQRIMSQPGKKNGLYWPATAGAPQSPIGEAVAEASQRGYRVGNGEPFHGYRYKILTRQGPNSPGGAHNYIVNGKMIGGFALIAYPAEYGNSGIATFLINHTGDIWEKDLGADTNRIASRMTSFNPDHTWRKVVDTEEQK